MTDPWLPPAPLRETAPGVFRADRVIAPDSPWLDGHFPQRPLVPGVALVAFAFDAARRAAGRDGSAWRPAGTGKLRFRRLVTPGEPLTVEVRASETAGEWRFEVRHPGGVAAQGVLRLTPESVP